MGHHFYTITRQLLKVEKISSALEERYTYFREQLNLHSQTAVDSSREAVLQVQKLWEKKEKNLAKLRKKIDNVPPDFREDLNHYYLQVCKKTSELFCQCEEDLARYGYSLSAGC